MVSDLGRPGAEPARIRSGGDGAAQHRDDDRERRRDLHRPLAPKLGGLSGIRVFEKFLFRRSALGIGIDPDVDQNRVLC